MACTIFVQLLPHCTQPSCLISYNPKPLCEVGNAISPISWMKKMRFREVYP